MFRKVHLKLTILFTSVSSGILIGMSLLFLFFHTQNLYQNAESKFKQDIKNFLYTFESNSVVTYGWLASVQNSYDYDFYIYDNNVPMRFMYDTKSQEELQFIEKLKNEKSLNISHEKNSYSPSHTELHYKTEKNKYMVSIIKLFGINSDTEIYVVYSFQKIQIQLSNLYLKFTIVIISGIILLFLFSWIYTNKLLKPIKESQEQQSQFIAAASHEIRNPVNTMLSALSAMEQANEEQKKEFLNIAKKEGSRLTYLTKDLLTLSLSDNKVINMNLGKAELDTILIDCYEGFLQPAREKNITLSISLPEEPLVSECMDGERIRQVISILLDNAISYTPSQGKIMLKCEKSRQRCAKLRRSLCGAAIKRYFVITVADNGIGLDEEQKKHVFERFYRGDKSRHSKEHFGLGLSIAKEIVDLHRGQITVEDTPGGGTTFLLYIPCDSF